MKEKLKNTKFKLDSSILYKDLIKLLDKNDFCTKYALKPIEDQKEVHSIFIKPDGEVTYILKSEHSETYYNSGTIGIYDFAEIKFSEALDILEYFPADIQESENTPINKVKKNKFITIDSGNVLFVFRKKSLNRFVYNKESNILYIYTKNERTEIYIDEVKYQKFIRELTGEIYFIGETI